VERDTKRLKSRAVWLARHKLKILLATALMIGAAVLVGASTKARTTTPRYHPGHGGDEPAAHSTPSRSPSATGSPGATASATALPPLDLQGVGGQRTAKFGGGANWELDWSYDCTKTGRPGHFNVTAYTSDSQPVTDPGRLTKLGSKDTGVQHYSKAGTFYLIVITECSWHIVTKG